MIFLYIILFFIFNFLICLVGKTLIRLLKFKNNFIYIDLIYGVFLIGFIAFFLNFFIALDNLIVKILFFLIIFISLKYLDLKKYNEYLLIFAVSILIFPIIIYMGPGYDGGLYHLPHQNFIKHEKIVFGIGNIRRFGFGSINEYISALLWYKENFVLLKFIQGTYFLIFFLFIIENIKKQNINIKIILPIIFLLPLLQRYFTLSFTFTDIATIVFYTLCFVHGFIFLIKKKDNFNLERDVNTFIILLFLTVAMKPNGSLVLIYGLIVFLFIFFKFKQPINFFLKFYWIYFIFFLWFLKNIITTGCIVYPITFSCFTFLEWSAHTNALYDFVSAKSFARQPFVGNESLYSWNWLKDYWINVYDKFIISYIFLNVLILLNLNLITFLLKRKFFFSINVSVLISFFIISLFFQESGLTSVVGYFSTLKNIFFTNKYLILLTLVIVLIAFIILLSLNKNKINLYLFSVFVFIIISIVLWFLNSPVPRFGLFLFFILSMLATFLFSNLDNEILISDLKIKNTLMICIIYYLTIISSQATKSENMYTLKNITNIYWIDIFRQNNFSYPKKGLGLKEDEIIPDIGLIKRDYYGYKPNTSDQCWLKLDCYPYKDVIVYKNKFNYKFMKLVKEE